MEPPLWFQVVVVVKSLQLCLTLCDPIDSSPPGSTVPGILQARTLEWVAISFSNAWKWKVKVKSLSCVRLFTTPWTAAYQAPPSMGFSRQEYWSGMPSPYPRLIVVYSNLFCVTVFPWKLHQMIKVLLPLSLTNMQYYDLYFESWVKMTIHNLQEICVLFLCPYLKVQGSI